MGMAEILMCDSQLRDGLPKTTPTLRVDNGQRHPWHSPQELNLSHSVIHQVGRAGGLM